MRWIFGSLKTGRNRSNLTFKEIPILTQGDKNKKRVGEGIGVSVMEDRLSVAPEGFLPV